MLMFVLINLALTSGLSCPSYACYSDGKFYEKQCIYASKQSVIIRECSSSLVPYCEPYAKNSTCQPELKENRTATAWPGEKCGKDSECSFGMCFKGTCNSLDLGKTCALDDQCNPGLFCNMTSTTCAFQIRPGDSGCTQDTDCWNSAGCNNGVCFPYYTLPSGTILDTCNENKNLLCQSLTCGRLDDKLVCGSGVKLAGSSCSSSSDCLSTVDSVLGYSLTSSCKCSLSKAPQSLCTYFPGDDDFIQYIKQNKLWTTSNEIRKCNTQRRFADGCLSQSTIGSKTMYFKLTVDLYPMIYKNEKCTKNVFNKLYWDMADTFDDEEQFKTLKASFRNLSLSEVIDENDGKNKSFQARNLGITQIDKLQFSCIKIKKLDLSQNRIEHLTGLNQFPNLTSLNVSQNLIKSLNEILKIQNKSNLVYLYVNSNPFTRHPSTLSLVVQMFPKLKKLDQVPVTDLLKQEVLAGGRLEKKIPEFFTKSLEMIENTQKEVTRLKIQFEILQACKNRFNQADGPYWEDINARHLKELKKIRKIPSFSSFSKGFEYKTPGINDFLDFYSKAICGLENRTVYNLDGTALLFKKVLIKLHSWGLHNLQLFINENLAGQDSSDEELNFFLSLSIFSQSKLLKVQKKPAKNLSPVDLASEHPVIENFNHFPVFPDNKNYLKAVFECLLEQLNILQELHREKEELLSFDASCLGIPSLVDRFRLPEDLTEASCGDFFQEFSRYEAQGGSEPSRVHSCRYEQAPEEETSNEMKKIFEVSDEIDQIQQKTLNFNEIFQNSLNRISSISLKRMQQVMKDLLLYSGNKTRKINQKLKNLQISNNFHRNSKLKKIFQHFKALRILAKCKSLKAVTFYTGRLKLDVFYTLKSYSMRQKRLKKALQVRKANEMLEKAKIKKEVEDEFGKIVSRLTENQSNIKRIWKILDSQEKSRCFCGGFKCENCTNKKLKCIKKELGFLKEKISKDVKNRC